MTPTRTIREVSRNYLLALTSDDQHEHIRSLWADPTVDYIVLFAGKELSSKKILSIGSGQDFETIADVAGTRFNGMHPVACARSQSNPAPVESVQSAPKINGLVSQKKKMDEIEDLESRLAYIEESEEKLSERAQAIVVREMELQQWEESLRQREQRTEKVEVGGSRMTFGFRTEGRIFSFLRRREMA